MAGDTVTMNRKAVASYFYGNLFDGQRGGTVTTSVDRLVEEMVDVVFYLFEDVAKALMPEGYAEVLEAAEVPDAGHPSS